MKSILGSKIPRRSCYPLNACPMLTVFRALHSHEAWSAFDVEVFLDVKQYIQVFVHCSEVNCVFTAAKSLCPGANGPLITIRSKLWTPLEKSIQSKAGENVCRMSVLFDPEKVQS